MGKNIPVQVKSKIVSESEKCWDSGLKTISACGKAPSSVNVIISPNAKDKIERLMKKFESIEWLAYLVGEDNKVDDIYIPPQKVSAGAVTDIDSSICNKIPVIGVIHSHHSMGNGFSSTDNEWINANHNISLCISKSGINGQVRWKTPCGSLMIVPSNVVVDIPTDYDEAEFERQIEENIEEKTYTNVGFYSNYKNYQWKDDNFIKKYIGSDKREAKDERESFLFVDDDDMTLQDELDFFEMSGMFDEKSDD